MVTIEVIPDWSLVSLSLGGTVRPVSIELNLSATGPKGDKGDKGDTGETGAAGPNSIGGYAIQLTNPSQNDVLAFQSNKWVNNPQSNLTDGGNF